MVDSLWNKSIKRCSSSFHSFALIFTFDYLLERIEIFLKYSKDLFSNSRIEKLRKLFSWDGKKPNWIKNRVDQLQKMSSVQCALRNEALKTFSKVLKCHHHYQCRNVGQHCICVRISCDVMHLVKWNVKHQNWTTSHWTDPFAFTVTKTISTVIGFIFHSKEKWESFNFVHI